MSLSHDHLAPVLPQKLRVDPFDFLTWQKRRRFCVEERERRLDVVRKNMAENTEEGKDNVEEREPLDWSKSESKALLRRKLIFDQIPSNLKPKQVFMLDYEVHKAWEEKKDYENWSKGLNRLRKQIGRDRGRMLTEVGSFGADLAIVNKMRAQNPNPKPRWHGSDAERLLKKDVKEGKHLQLKPRELWLDRNEYRVFSLDEFRPHIYQRADAMGKRKYRFEKKKKAWLYPELHENEPRLQNSDSDSDGD